MTVVTNNTIQPSSGQALTIKDEGGTASITVATNGEATFAENIIVGTAGKGITFGGDPDSRVNSPTTGNRTLYDYEEGYFNPTSTITLDSGEDTLSYTKIGRVVYIQGRLGFNATGSGEFTLSNLPFTLGTTSTMPEKAFHPNIFVTFTGLNSASNESIHAYYSNGTTFRIRDGGNGVDSGQTFGSHIDSGTTMYISGFYFVD